jgi:hypothetical protein
MDGLFGHSLIVVTGKGGVGKSTVAAALGLAASRRGLHTIVVEVAARDDISRALGADAAGGCGERVVPEGPQLISIDPQRAMEDYLRRQLPVGALAALLARGSKPSNARNASAERRRLTKGVHEQQAEVSQPERTSSSPSRSRGATPVRRGLRALQRGCRGPSRTHGFVATSWQQSLLQIRPMCPKNRTIWTFRKPADVSGGCVQG